MDKKIDKFLTWLEIEKRNAESRADGSASSWNWAYYEALKKVYDKAEKSLK